MKHVGQQSLTDAIGDFLGQRVIELLGDALPDAVVPLPLHWRRRILRGPGTSGMLADALCRVTGIPQRPGVLRCRRLTQKQSTLSPAGRRTNVTGAFALHPRHSIQAIRLALVDDTLTTGATVNEAAKILRRGGAKSVSVFVVARAV